MRRILIRTLLVNVGLVLLPTIIFVLYLLSYLSSHETLGLNLDDFYDFWYAIDEGDYFISSIFKSLRSWWILLPLYLSTILVLVGLFKWVVGFFRDDSQTDSLQWILAGICMLGIFILLIALAIFVEQVIFAGKICLGFSCGGELHNIKLVPRP